MIEWDDDAIVLSARPHGETAAVIHVFARDHGRDSGLVHGGGSRAARAVLQSGNRIRASWRGRLAEQLGTFRVELVSADVAPLLGDRDRLTAVAAACAVAEVALPDRQPHPAAFAALSALLDALASDAWPSVYVHWEMALLRDLGFGLDLSSCAATGSRDDLAYVSPKSGQAVSREAGAPYRDRLLPLPRFLLNGGEGDPAGVRDGLTLAAYFLERHVLSPHHRPMPAARQRLVDRMVAIGTIS